MFTVLIVEMFSQLYIYFTAKQIINFNDGHFISILCNKFVLKMSTVYNMWGHQMLIDGASTIQHVPEAASSTQKIPL